MLPSNTEIIKCLPVHCVPPQKSSGGSYGWGTLDVTIYVSHMAPSFVSLLDHR